MLCLIVTFLILVSSHSEIIFFLILMFGSGIPKAALLIYILAIYSEKLKILLPKIFVLIRLESKR